MPGTFSDSWRITRMSFSLIAQDRALLVFPIVAALAAVGILALFVLGVLYLAPLLLVGGSLTTSYEVVGLVLFVVAYFSLTFVTVYATAGLVGAATLKLDGQQPTAADGWRVARANLGRLVVWALIAATVGLLIQLLASRLRGAAGLVVGVAAGLSWAIVTYFIVPVILYEHESPWRSLARSAKLFASTFGRTLVTNLVVGLILAAGVIGAVVLGVLGLVELFGGSLPLGLALLVAGLALGIFVVLIGATVEGILRAALYRYATTGKIDPALMPSGYLSAKPAPLQ